MSSKELHEAAKKRDVDKVERLVDEERVDVDSLDGVSVCVLWLLILVLFGIEWNDCFHPFFLQGTLERGTTAAISRSEPYDQG